MTIITKTDVLNALLELRVNRPRILADRHIRALLARYGDGATSIGTLAPEFYEPVYLAAGGRVGAVAPAPVSRRWPDTPLVHDLRIRLEETIGSATP
ncbi:MAG: hypothetical protein ACLPTZ_16320 [Beijerinckiaceae bacterium]